MLSRSGVNFSPVLADPGRPDQYRAPGRFRRVSRIPTTFTNDRFLAHDGFVQMPE